MALGQIGDARASHALMAVLRADREPEVRKAAAYSLGQIGTSEVLDALLQTVSNGTEASSVRGMAVEALTYLRESSGHVVSTLRAVLGDPAPEVRFWAAFALGELGDPAALEDLRRVTSDTGKVPGYGSVADEAKEAIARIEERNREVGIPEFPQAT
jgi:HEAT repeat protein